ncbi:AraC family transcriptional regulator [Paenibacillus sp. 32352]|uniref:AraC family transcriptional regulator n=1 Tax=Paenibacillus sp. 32352 TaxID=1969111 RepID=UPI0015C4B8F7|nr:helix-turn-helix domain-containing protein [Paenibacillus sp. 32352]
MRTLIHRSLFMRMLMYFVIVVSLVTILLSYILYANFEKSAMASLNKAYQRNLSQVSFSVSYMNESVRNLLWSVFNSTDTTVLMYQDDTMMEELVPEFRKLNHTVETYPFVQSIYIYNQKLDRYIATGASPISSGEQFYDREVVGWIQEKRLPQPSVPVARMIPSPGDPMEMSKVFTYILYEMKSDAGGVSGAVIVNIKAEYLQNLIDSFSRGPDQDEGGETLVVNRNGLVVSHSEGRSFLSDVSGESFFARILKQGGDTGSFEHRERDDASLVTYVTSDQSGWIFVQIQSYGSALTKVRHIRFVTVVVSTAVLLTSIAASILLSHRLYRPIGQLVSSARRVSEAETTTQGNSGKLADLHIVQEVLTKAYVANQGTFQTEKRVMLKRLITDPQMPDEMGSYIIKKYGYSLGAKKSYVLLLAKIDRYAEFQANYSEKDRTLLCYAIVNAASELFGVHYATETAELDDQSICILLGLHPEDERDEQESIVAVVKELQNWCSQSLRLSLTVSVSSGYARLSHIRQAYHETQQLSYYRLVYGQGSILHADKVGSARKPEAYRLLAREEQALREALIDGKTDEAMWIYDEFMEETASRTHDVIMSNVLYITYVVHNILYVIEENSLDEYNLDLGNWIRQIHQAETLEEIRDMFHGIFIRTSETVGSRKQNRGSVLLDSVIALMEAKYTDPNLSMEGIADEIGMSKDYISKMFRKAYGKSIPDYLLDLRIGKVIELMEDPSLGFSDILNRVGIENKKYFYTLFKKKMGVSLRDYRIKQLPLDKNGNLS